MYPTNLRYTKEHEWVRLDGDVATVGITDYAQKELGDIVFVEITAEGDDVKTGDVLGTIESVKAVSELYSPLTGNVTEFNGSLEDAPEKVNLDPHGDGWICKIQVADAAEFEQLLEAAGYQEIIAG
jgi:glycine cleavage system H protein